MFYRYLLVIFLFIGIIACSSDSDNPNPSKSSYSGGLATKYTASGDISITFTGCENLPSGSIFRFDTATYKIVSGDDSRHEGIVVLTKTIGQDVTVATIKTTGGIVTTDKVSGTLTSTLELNSETVTTGSGDYSGTLSGNELSIDFSVQDNIGGCLSEGSIVFVAENSNAITPGGNSNTNGDFGTLTMTGLDTPVIGTEFTPETGEGKIFTLSGVKNNASYTWELKSTGSLLYVLVDGDNIPTKMGFSWFDVATKQAYIYESNCGVTIVCSGVMIDDNAQTVTFANLQIITGSQADLGPITFNGVLNFDLVLGTIF